jgi:hypothetical protein
MSDLSEVLNRVTIGEVWQALGGAESRYNRAPAFWRKTRDCNVSLNNFKGTWYDFRDSVGGGILDLVSHVRGGSRADALRWLADTFCIALPDDDQTPAERAEAARRRREAEREARPLAQLALWWLTARMGELSDAKAAAIKAEEPDFPRLAAAARELYRLEKLTADDVVREYLRYREQHPRETAGLVHIGRTWAQACEAAARAVVRKIGESQHAA